MSIATSDMLSLFAIMSMKTNYMKTAKMTIAEAIQ